MFDDGRWFNSKKLALVADDDETQQQVLKAHLEDAGYDVISAYDGVEAVDVFKQYYPHLVLLDINMPYLDGWQTARKIRELATKHFVPILFVSGTDTDEAFIKSIDAGGDAFMSFPFSEVKFKAKLKALSRIGDLYRKYYVMQQEQIRDQEVAEQLFSRVIESGNIVSEKIEIIKKAATIFSGDIILTAQGPDGTIHALLGDFTGHGLKSIVGAFSLSEIFRTMISKGYYTKIILNQINHKLFQILPNDMFLASALVSINPQDSIAQVWNSGLPDVLIVDGVNGKIKHRVESNHPPLGILPSLLTDATHAVFNLEINDYIILLSDGVLEARNPVGNMFGEKSLKQAIQNKSSNQTFAQNIIEKLDVFCKTAPQDDDISLISIPISIVNELTLPSLLNCKVTNFDSVTPIKTVMEDAELWTWKTAMSGSKLANTNLVPLVMNYIQEVEGRSQHWNNLYTILTELYINALDHGILNLSSSLKNSPEGFVEYYKIREQRIEALTSGKIEIQLTRIDDGVGGRLIIKMKDSGSGFNVKEFMSKHNKRDNSHGLSGRGIKLVQGLCDSLNYSDNGSSVEVEYSWKNTDDES